MVSSGSKPAEEEERTMSYEARRSSGERVDAKASAAAIEPACVLRGSLVLI